MDCTEAYKEHIMYSFNGFCKVVIRYAAINAWRDRNRRRQREISFEYLTEEKFYPLSTSDEFLKSPYEQYPVTICGQTIILTNGELAAALLSLPEKKREIIYLYFFGNYTQQEIADLRGLRPYIRGIDRLRGHQEHHKTQEYIVGCLRGGVPMAGFLSCRGRGQQFVFQSQFVNLL